MAVDPTDTEKYPLGSDNLLVLQRNASDFDKVIAGEDDTVTNRFGDEIKSMKALNDVFNEAETSATEAAASATEAAESELAASGYANYKGDWAAVTDVLQGESYSYGGTTWTAKQDSAGQAPAEGVYWLRGNGTAAQLDTGTASDQIPTNGDLGTAAQVDVGADGSEIPSNETMGHIIGSTTSTRPTYIADWNNLIFSSLNRGYIYLYDTSTLNMPAEITDVSTAGELECFKTALGQWGGFILRHRSAIAKVDFANNVYNGVSVSWDTSNTTVDGSGFIKEASPIVKLYDDTIEVEGLSKFGGTPAMTRVSTGVYEIAATQGLRLGAGWYIETPNDRNGNKYFNIDWSQNIEPENTNGVVSELTEGVVVTIETFKRVWNSETGLFENGDPVDICENQTRAVSLRFNEIVQVEEE